MPFGSQLDNAKLHSQLFFQFSKCGRHSCSIIWHLKDTWHPSGQTSINGHTCVCLLPRQSFAAYPTTSLWWYGKIIAISVVRSRLDYANSVLYGTSTSNINKLQRVQNTFGKVVVNNKFCSSAEALHQLHIGYPLNSVSTSKFPP